MNGNSRVFLKNGITKCGKSYSKCFFCNDLIITHGENGIFDHLNQACHKKRRSQNSKIKFEGIESLSDNDCFCLMHNNISFTSDCYYCNFCCSTFHDFLSVQQHVNALQHHLNSKVHLENLLENQVVFKDKFYYCEFCNIILENRCAAKKHIEKQNHKNCMKIQNQEQTEPKETSESSKPVANEINIQDTIFERTIRSKSSLLPIYKNNQMALKINYIELCRKRQFKCLVCECTMPINTMFNHVYELDHLKRLHLKKLENNIYRKKKNITNNTEKVEYFYCKKCCFYLTLSDALIQCHCMFHLYEEHLISNFELISLDCIDVVKLNVNNKKKIEIKCLLCNYKMNSYEKLSQHIENDTHLLSWQRNLLHRNFATEETNAVQPLDSYKFNPVRDFNPKSFCLACHTPATTDFTGLIKKFNKLEKGSGHAQHTEATSEIRLSRFHFYRCFLCNDSFLNIKILFDHYSNDPVHKHRLNNLKVYVNWKNTEQAQNIETPTHDELSALSASSSSESENESPKAVDHRPFNEDLLKYGAKYILMCIESGNENIYSCSPGELELVERGVTFTVPSDERGFCIPCACEISLELSGLFEHLQDEEHVSKLSDLENGSTRRLELASSGLLEESDRLMKCLACDQTSPNKLASLELHLNSEGHSAKFESWKRVSRALTEKLLRVLREYWYHALEYHCAPCGLELSDELSFVKHLEQPEHLARLDSSARGMNKCLACRSCWYGARGSHDCRGTNCAFPSMAGPDQQLLGRPDQVSKDLLREVEENLRARRKNEKKLLGAVESTAKVVEPEAKARTVGLDFLGGELDVFVDCGEANIRKLRRAFEDKKMWMLEGQESPRPGLAVINLEHRTTRLKCRLSLGDGLEVEKFQLIRNYVMAYQNCRKLIMYLKKWFDTMNMYKSQAVSLYAISWFAIFYLQIKGIFPNVRRLIKYTKKSKEVCGWECSFPDKVLISNNASDCTLEDLLRGFFLYYAEFDFCTSVVCPFLGKVIRKRDFVKIDDMPKKMKIYKHRLENEEVEYFAYYCPMCIQDPLELSQNITRNITKQQLQTFRQYCNESSKMRFNA